MSADTVAELLRQIAYLDAGGKGEGQRDIDKISAIFSGIAGTAKDIGAAGLNFANTKKTLAETKKLQHETDPIGSDFGVPTGPQEEAMRQLFNKQQEDRYAGLDAKAAGISNYLQGQGFKNVTVGDPNEVRPQFQSKREGFQKQFGISPDTPADKLKEFITLKALSGGAALYHDGNGNTQVVANGEQPPIGWSKLADIKAPQAANLMANKENARITSNNIDKRQEKTQTFEKNQQTQRQENERQNLTADQQKKIDALEQLKGLTDSYFTELDKVAPVGNTAGSVLKAGLNSAVAKVPLVGSVVEPKLRAFEDFRQAQRPKLAKALGDVGNMTELEQQSALKLFPGPLSSAAERQQAIQNIRGLIETSYKASETVQSQKMNQSVRGGKQEQRVAVIAPDGTPGYIPVSQIQDAVKQGFRVK